MNVLEDYTFKLQNRMIVRDNVMEDQERLYVVYFYDNGARAGRETYMTPLNWFLA